MSARQTKTNIEIARRFFEEFIGKNNQSAADEMVRRRFRFSRTRSERRD